MGPTFSCHPDGPIARLVSRAREAHRRDEGEDKVWVAVLQV